MIYDLITKYTGIFVEKNWEKLLHCNKKYWHIWDITVWNFNETLTNDIVSFEQPGPEVVVWFVGCSWFIDPLRHIVFHSISGCLPEKGRKKRENLDEIKYLNAPTASAVASFKYIGCPGTRNFTQHHRTTRPRWTTAYCFEATLQLFSALYLDFSMFVSGQLIQSAGLLI